MNDTDLPDKKKIEHKIELVVSQFEKVNSSINHYLSFWNGLGAEVVYELDRLGFTIVPKEGSNDKG